MVLTKFFHLDFTQYIDDVTNWHDITVRKCIVLTKNVSMKIYRDTNTEKENERYNKW